MANTNRFLILGGGHVAALTLLLLSACGPGGDKRDSGQSPDAGPMADADVDMPDAGLPSDDGGEDLGTMPDLGTDGGIDECTPEMMLNRVMPPCEPDLPVGMVPDGLFPVACLDTMNGDVWADSSGSGSTSIEHIVPPYEPVGGIWIYCPSSTASSGISGYVYGRDGIFYANWKNAAEPGLRGNHARLTVNADCTLATVQMFGGGNTSDTPDAVGSVWRQ